ncbi:MAG: hypothetical protein ACEQSB_00725 [Undibacterium sp.]
MSKSIFEVMPTPSANSELNFEDGDCGIIIKENGEYFAFTGTRASEGLNKPHDEMNDADVQRSLNGQYLLALSFAMGNPQVMSILQDVVAQIVKLSEAVNDNAA